MKLIDSEKQRTWIKDQIKSIEAEDGDWISQEHADWNEMIIATYKRVLEETDAGTFDPTPVQPDIRPGDKVRVTGKPEWTWIGEVLFLEDDYKVRVDFGEEHPFTYTIPCVQLEVIK